MAPLATVSTSLEQPFSVYSRIGVLPEDDSSNVGRMLTLAAAQARSGQAAAAVQLLDDLIDRLQADFESTDSQDDAYVSRVGTSGSGRSARRADGAPLSPYLVPACVYAQLLDLCEDPFADAAAPSSAGDEDSSTSGSGGGGGGGSSSASGGSPLQRLVSFQLRERVQGAAKDSLSAPAASMARLLGARHPVSRVLADLAEETMSLGARQARELRQQQMTLAASMEVLKVRACMCVFHIRARVCVHVCVREALCGVVRVGI